MQRLGVVMEPEPGNPLEVEGVLNPASARGPDGQIGGARLKLPECLPPGGLADAPQAMV